MLCADSSMFIVYPSWAGSGLAYRWSDLPVLLRDPLTTPYLTHKKEYYQDCGFSLHPASMQFWSGHAGGGIIKAVTPADGRWLGTMVFVNTNIRAPDELLSAWKAGLLQCCYLEPYEYYVDESGNQHRATLYPARLTVQHTEHVGDDAYWVLRHTATKRADAMIDTICSTGWFTGEQLSLRVCETVSESLNREAGNWFTNPRLKTTWIAVSADSCSSGFHAALLTYVAFAMKAVYRSQLSSAHLVARFDIAVDGIGSAMRQQW